MYFYHSKSSKHNIKSIHFTYIRFLLQHCTFISPFEFILFFIYCISKHYNSHIILPFCISLYFLHIWLALKNVILKNSFYIYWNVCHFKNFALLQVEPRFLVANNFISILRKPYRILINKFWWLKIILSFAFFF